MTTYASKIPGVYLENVPEPRAVELHTGVPVFLGGVSALPPEIPREGAVARLTRSVWIELDRREKRTGTSWTTGHLGAALRGFFENEGSFCYVVGLAGAAALDAALDALDAHTDFDLIAAPGLVGSPVEELAAAQAKILQRCKARGDCFAILDAIENNLADRALLLQSVKAHRDALDAAMTSLAGLQHETLRRCGALYFPWVRTLGGLAPPCGHVAGVYARTDDRRGFFKAPANEVVEGVIDLALYLSQKEQEELIAPSVTSVNCLRAFPGRGIRIWGARTLSLGQAWRHINVRRTITTIGRWFEVMMTDFLFEQNDARLWIRINREVSALLETLYRRGALQGATASDAYFVKCDAETNPKSVRDAGEVVTEVGLAPSSPREFIVVRLVHNAGGVVSVTAEPNAA